MRLICVCRSPRCLEFTELRTPRASRQGADAELESSPSILGPAVRQRNNAGAFRYPEDVMRYGSSCK
jgi:hypothetical protein